jgi:hypothetical protein
MKTYFLTTLLTAILFLIAAGNAAAATETNRAEAEAKQNSYLVKKAVEKLKTYGVEFNAADVILLNSKAETEERVKNFADREKVLTAVAFAEFSKPTVYINTWDETLWRGIASPQITDSKAREAAAVIVASLLIHERFHASEPANAFDNMNAQQRANRIYKSEVGALTEELKLLQFFKNKGVSFLDIPIAETENSIKFYDAKLAE